MSDRGFRASVGCGSLPYQRLRQETRADCVLCGASGTPTTAATRGLAPRACLAPPSAAPRLELPRRAHGLPRLRQGPALGIESTGFPPSPPRRMRTCSRRGTACSCRTGCGSASSRPGRRGCRDGGGGSSCDRSRLAWEPNVGSLRVSSRRIFLSVLFRQPSTETLRK